MIDVSDGLGQDLDHVCLASGTGARLIRRAIPLAEGVRETAEWAGVDPVIFAVRGGDDYELVMAVKPEDLDELTAAVAPTPLTRVGDITSGDRAHLVDGSDAVDVARSGWDQFQERS